MTAMPNNRVLNWRVGRGRDDVDHRQSESEGSNFSFPQRPNASLIPTG